MDNGKEDVENLKIKENDFTNQLNSEDDNHELSASLHKLYLIKTEVDAIIDIIKTRCQDSDGRWLALQQLVAAVIHDIQHYIQRALNISTSKLVKTEHFSESYLEDDRVGQVKFECQESDGEEEKEFKIEIEEELDKIIIIKKDLPDDLDHHQQNYSEHLDHHQQNYSQHLDQEQNYNCDIISDEDRLKINNDEGKNSFTIKTKADTNKLGGKKSKKTKTKQGIKEVKIDPKETVTCQDETKLHLKTVQHPDKNLRKCKFCDLKFSDKKSLLLHKRQVHVDQYKVYRCVECDRNFANSGHYEFHMQGHTGDKLYTCDQCGKGFKMKSHLARHIKNVHEGIKRNPCLKEKIVCGKCGKSFATKQRFKLHELTHRGSRDFKCDVCSKAFIHQRNLTRHITQVHQRIRKFACQVCTHPFASRWHVKQHMRQVHKDFPDLTAVDTKPNIQHQDVDIKTVL